MTESGLPSVPVSFSRRVKDELCRIACEQACCLRTELSTAFMAAGRPHRDRLVIATSHPESAVRLADMIRTVLDIEPEIQSGRELITITIRKASAAGPSAWVTGNVDDLIPIEDGSLCCSQAFVRALFLYSGSVSEPSAAYHMEFSIRHPVAAEKIRRQLEQFDFRITLSRRGHQHVLYVQEGQNMADYLLLAGAHQSLLAFESLRVEKEVRNSVNRVVNCDSANTQRLANAAARQLDLIGTLSDHGLFDQLPADLRLTAETRLNNPDLSLKELGAVMEPPLGKSGMNHRLKRLEQIALDWIGEKVDEKEPSK